MTDAPEELLKLIHETKAVSIWNRHNGPVFWYAVGTPGPFYVNTELVIGPSIAEDLLRQITATLADVQDTPTAVARITRAVLSAYDNSVVYQRVIKMLADAVASKLPNYDYSLITGGERRDWLFSIPFARLCGKRHVFLFKKKGAYCEQPYTPHEQALHVADLINNGASFFDQWFPALEVAKIDCMATACIVTRGNQGVDKLESGGCKVVKLHSIDKSFFEKLHAARLIDRDALAEVLMFFESPAHWGEAYLLHDTAVFDVKGADGKALVRLKSFLANDPWNLRGKHEDFFADLEEQLGLRASADEAKMQSPLLGTTAS